MSLNAAWYRVRAMIRCASGVTSLGLELEAHLGRLLRLDGDLAGLRAQALVPGLERVLAGRHLGDRVRAVVGGHREEGVAGDGHVAGHPGVDVALELDDLARVVELLGDG